MRRRPERCENKTRMKSKPQMDTRWSWVVLACLWISLFLLSFVFLPPGILQVEIIDDFQMGSGPVSMMTSLFFCLASFLGPVSGILASLLSIRRTVFLGVSIIAVGHLCASFCYTLPSMVFFYGIFSGIGLGISQSPLLVAVSFYFEKKRLMATGILMCAPGLGCLCVPAITRFIIDAMGWRYCLVLNGAISLNAMVFIAFLVPTVTERASMIDLSSPWCMKGRRNLKRTEDLGSPLDATDFGSNSGDKTQEADKQIVGDVILLQSNEEYKCSHLSPNNYDFQLKPSDLSENHVSKSISSLNNRNGLPYIPVYANGTPEAKRAFQPLNHDSEVTVVSIPNNSSARDLHVSLETLEDGVTLPPIRDRSVSELSDHSLTSTGTGLTADHHTPRSHTPRMFGQLRKGGSHRSFLSSNIRWASQDIGSTFMLPIKVEEISSDQDMEEQKAGVKYIIKRVLRHTGMWILGINSLLLFCGVSIHSIHFPAYAESKGATPQEVSFFYSIFGVMVIMGRLGGGAVYNRFNPPLIPVLISLQLCNGLVLGLAPFYATTVPGICVMEGAFGGIYGQCYMLLAPALAQMMPVGDVPIAFGMTHLCVGFAYLLSPTLAGFIYDATKTYDVSFHLAGSFVIIGSTLLFFLVCKKKDAHVKEKVSEEDEDGLKMEPLIDQ